MNAKICKYRKFLVILCCFMLDLVPFYWYCYDFRIKICYLKLRLIG